MANFTLLRGDETSMGTADADVLTDPGGRTDRTGYLDDGAATAWSFSDRAVWRAINVVAASISSSGKGLASATQAFQMQRSSKSAAVPPPSHWSNLPHAPPLQTLVCRRCSVDGGNLELGTYAYLHLDSR